MDPVSIIGIIVGLATIIGVIVQVVHYFEERREKNSQPRQSNETIGSSATKVLHKSALSGEAFSREKRLIAVRVQLMSSLPSDYSRGINQVVKWLRENPEDEEVYILLLDVVSESPRLLSEVHNIFIEMVQRGSKFAARIIRALPESQLDLLTLADDAYYANQYEEAIRLYQRVLKIEPDNNRAKEQLVKAQEYLKDGTAFIEVPREAIVYYRRARSYIAFRAFEPAINLLSAAIESANASRVSFPDAERALAETQNLLIADEYIKKADILIGEEKWRDALDLYRRALLLDPSNSSIIKLHDSLRSLIDADVLLDELTNKQVDNVRRKENLENVRSSLNMVERVEILANTTLLDNVRNKYSKFRKFRTSR